MSTPSLDSVPWVAFLRRDPKTSRVVTAVNRPNALAAGRSALRSNDVDVVVICEGESNAEAVARVAGSVE